MASRGGFGSESWGASVVSDHAAETSDASELDRQPFDYPAMSVTVNAYHHLPILELIGLMCLGWALVMSYQLVKHELHRRYYAPIVDAVDRATELQEMYP